MYIDVSLNRFPVERGKKWAKKPLKQVVVANLYNCMSSWVKFPGFDASETSVLQLGITMRSRLRQPPKRCHLSHSGTWATLPPRPAFSLRCAVVSFSHWSHFYYNTRSVNHQRQKFCIWTKLWEHLYIGTNWWSLASKKIAVPKLIAIWNLEYIPFFINKWQEKVTVSLTKAN